MKDILQLDELLHKQLLVNQVWKLLNQISNEDSSQLWLKACGMVEVFGENICKSDLDRLTIASLRMLYRKLLFYQNMSARREQNDFRGRAR